MILEKFHLQKKRLIIQQHRNPLTVKIGLRLNQNKTQNQRKTLKLFQKNRRQNNLLKKASNQKFQLHKTVYKCESWLKQWLIKSVKKGPS